MKYSSKAYFLCKLILGGFWIWVIFTLAILSKAAWATQFFEDFFAPMVFAQLRNWTNGVSLVSWIPLYVIFWSLVAVSWYLIWKKLKTHSFLQRLHWLTAYVAFIFASFYWVWGFCYRDSSLGEKLSLTQIELDSCDLMGELIMVSSELNRLRPNLQLMETDHKEDSLLARNQERLFRQWGIPYYGDLRIRRIPFGGLLRFSTSGIYWPFSFEGHIDGGLHPLQKPYIIAHEMGHGQAIAGEGDCNFVGLWTCLKSGHSFFRYTALLNYYRRLAALLQYFEGQQPWHIHWAIDPEVYCDIVQIELRMDDYPDIFGSLITLIYDQYLKGQGISDGILDYDSVIDLMLAYRNQNTATHQMWVYGIGLDDGF